MSAKTTKRYQYRRAKRAAQKRRGIDFTLEFRDWCILKKKTHCYYTDIELTNGTGVVGRDMPTKLTLDRINCDVGYTKKNTVACCNSINSIKAVWERNRDCVSSWHLLKFAAKIWYLDCIRKRL